MQPRSPRTPLSDPGPLGSHGLAFSKLLRVFASCVQNPLLCSDLLACMSLRHSLTFLLLMLISGCIPTPHLVSVKERKARHTRAGGVPMPPVPGLQAGTFSLCPCYAHWRGSASKGAGVSPQREDSDEHRGRTGFPLTAAETRRGAWRSPLWESSEGPITGRHRLWVSVRGLGRRRREGRTRVALGLGWLGQALALMPLPR